ncbi:MAG: T9SS type A sorting domain-containing protein [Bacteroidales bacterium]|jgi:hypothetical protein|nr:T9SS type A sorting domain-containing protein [Bacteroidales bacterium]
MKRSLLFLSLILCFGIINAQNIGLKSFKKDVQKNTFSISPVVKANGKTTVKIVSNTKDPIEEGYSRITLSADDMMADGVTGVQLLLDGDATIVATIIANQAISAEDYAAFEYKLPENADGDPATSNVLVSGTLTLDIPIGTYDAVFVMPYSGYGLVPLAIADDFAFESQKQYDFTVEADGGVYLVEDDYDVAVVELTVPSVGTLTNNEPITYYAVNVGRQEATNVTIECIINGGTPMQYTIASIPSNDYVQGTFYADLSTVGNYSIYIHNTWEADENNTNDSLIGTTSCIEAPTFVFDFEEGDFREGWVLDNVDGQTNAEQITTQYSEYFYDNKAWDIIDGANFELTTGYVAFATSYFLNPVQANRWMITEPVQLNGNNSLLFDAMSLDASYPDDLEVLISTNAGYTTSDFTSIGTYNAVPGGTFTTYSIDLSEYSGKVTFAFRLKSTDKFILLLDNIGVTGNALSIKDNVNTPSFGLYPNPAQDQVTISNANGSQIRVVDVLGRVLINKTAKSESETLNISNLNQGVYMIQLEKDGKISSQKLIKK